MRDPIPGAESRPGAAGAELVLVRHGETTGESRVRLNGRTDVPLSEVGRAQMRRVAAALAGESFDRVLTTPLLRARESAAIAWPTGPAVGVPAFIEVDFGNWETLTYGEAQARDPHLFEPDPEAAASVLRPVRDAAFRYPGGESREGFRARIAGAVQTWLAMGRFRSADSPGGRCLAVLHKGSIRAALGALLGPNGFAVECDLASIHRLVLDPVSGAWTPVALNDVAHLHPDLHLP